MEFTHLHTHSHYSLLDGLAKIDQLLDHCQKLKMKALALTDHGSMYGLVEFYQKAKEKGIKPILGSEVYIAFESMDDRRPGIDDKRYHLVLLVKNKQGYQNLVQLTTQAWLRGFYYKPRIDKKLLRKHSQGLIGLSACLSGEIPKAIVNGHPDLAEKLALEYQDIFGPGNFYLELEHHPGLKDQEPVNQALIKISRKYNIPVVATNDIHYLNPEDAEAQDILMAIQTDKKANDENRLSMKDDDFSMRPPEQMIKDFGYIPEAIINTQKIVDQCQFDFELGKTQLPYFETPNQQNPEEYLRQLCYQGLISRYNFPEELIKKIEKDPQSKNLLPANETLPVSPEKIIDRLEYELSVINQMGFASYFLIVQDFVNWAKKQGIVVGPGRGSAAGSLVSYLLNITNIDPLKYDLLFERFLNPERISMPDIDLDFADDRRDEVIRYVAQKYGENHVAQIITFGTMAARAAVRDVGRAMGYPYNFCDQVAKMIPFGMNLERALQESQELNQSYQTDEATKKLIDMAKKLEGVARHASTHAAGVVITKEDINSLVPRQHPSQNDQTIVTQYEMRSIEALGLLKMDFLGLKTLTIIQNILNQVKNRTGQEIKLENIPLDDKATYELLKNGQTTGVFQLESAGMKRYLKELQPNEFEDIIAMVALYRPGPMEFIPEFIARKHGQKEIKYLHPQLEPILKNTYGICVYQEQLMQIAQRLAGFSLGEADTLRKAVGKKIKKLLDEQKEKMIQGMIKNNIPASTAEEIWHWIEPFARYGFNRSHATCYALVGYQTAYLKAHYPTEFMAALMTADQNDVERIAFLVDECRQMGIKVLPPNVNESEENFTVVQDKVIRFGLKAIKNVGHNIVETIVRERKNFGPFRSITDFIERVQCRDLNKKSLESLIKAGALDIFGERNQLLASLEQMLNYAREVQKAKTQGQISLFGGENSLNSFKLAQTTAATKKECLLWEKELLGLYISEHPLREYLERYSEYRLSCQSLKPYLGQRVNLLGLISKIKKINTKKGEPMLFVELEDLTGRIEVIVFPKTLQQTASLWQEEKIVFVSGRVESKEEKLQILCDGIKVIE